MDSLPATMLPLREHRLLGVVLLLVVAATTVHALTPPPRPGCDMTQGRWIRAANRFPRYSAATGRSDSCPYVRSEYACERNNRPDVFYAQYRWQPATCLISYFSAPGFKYMMKNKKMLLVGDSMMSNFYEALLCAIHAGGFKGETYTIPTGAPFDIRRVRFPALSLSLDFYFSPYIVKATKLSKVAPGDSSKGGGGHAHDVYVDQIDPVLAKHLAGYDVAVMATGVWWLQNKPGYREPNKFYANWARRNLTNSAAHTWGLATIANYLKSINYNGVPFFLSFSPKHAGKGVPQSGVINKKKGPNQAAWAGACGARSPILDAREKQRYGNTLSTARAYADAQKHVLAGTPLRFLDVTAMSEVRPDAHMGVWWQWRDRTGMNSPGQKRETPYSGDCTHWCLPGVPDAWVDILYSHMILEPPLVRK